MVVGLPDWTHFLTAATGVFMGSAVPMFELMEDPTIFSPAVWAFISFLLIPNLEVMP